MANTINFSGITPEKFVRIQQTAEEQTGLNIIGPAGEASKMGVDISWHYNETSELLAITINHKPFIVSEATVEKQITDFVHGA